MTVPSGPPPEFSPFQLFCSSTPFFFPCLVRHMVLSKIYPLLYGCPGISACIDSDLPLFSPSPLIGNKIHSSFCGRPSGMASAPTFWKPVPRAIHFCFLLEGLLGCEICSFFLYLLKLVSHVWRQAGGPSPVIAFLFPGIPPTSFPFLFDFSTPIWLAALLSPPFLTS